MSEQKIYLETGQRIADLRGDLTQAAFAQRLEVDRKTVVGWEAGKRLPDGTSLLKLMTEFDADVNYILTGIGSAAKARLDEKQRRISEAVDKGLEYEAVVSGERAHDAAQRKEIELLKRYRLADESGKKLIEGTAALAAQADKRKKA